MRTPSLARKWTDRIIELIDDGTFDPQKIAEMALGYLSEDEVKQMAQANELTEILWENDLEEDEED